MATVYKSTTYKEIDNREITPVDSTQNTKITNTLSNFFTYFKSKHL